MCKSVYTYLTICFAFEKPRWLLHNTADRAETVFSHLKSGAGLYTTLLTARFGHLKKGNVVFFSFSFG